MFYKQNLLGNTVSDIEGSFFIAVFTVFIFNL